MKKVISLILVLGLAASIGLTASAAGDTYAEFKTKYDSYKSMYNNSYEPAYDAYNASVKELADRVAVADITTQEEFDRLFAFVEYIRQTKTNFFGTRTTEDKSRYIVPSYRDAMYSAVNAKDYASAISYCDKLDTAVRARIGLVNSLETEIADFDVVKTGDGTIIMNANQIWSTSSFGFNIVLTNTSSQDVSNWTMSFDMAGASLNSVWINGGSFVVSKNGSNVSITPSNQWQYGYTIPAGGSITISGNANGNAHNVVLSNGVFNNKTASISCVIG